MERADTIIIGGAMAFPFLLAQGTYVGKANISPQAVETAKDCEYIVVCVGSDYKQEGEFLVNLGNIKQKPVEKQRQLIFWNEILYGNTSMLPNDITVMAWVGADRAAIEAAKRGMTTILSPQIPYYINRKQSPLPTEPMSQGRGTESVKAVYNYVPMKDVPEELQSKYIGVQANFWTEWIVEESVVQYLMLPRLAAVAEAGWTPQSKRNYDDFIRRLQAESKYYQMKGVNYAKHVMK